LGQLVYSFLLLIMFIFMFWTSINGIAIKIWADQESALYWPLAILGLLVILLFINTINIYRKIPKEERKINLNFKNISFKIITTRKWLIGFLLLGAYVVLLGFSGFIVTSFIFSMCYSRLLGEKRVTRLVINSLMVVSILYSIFAVMLGIILPRGMGLFRSFVIFLESLI